jgi:hypothetical protein
MRLDSKKARHYYLAEAREQRWSVCLSPEKNEYWGKK